MAGVGLPPYRLGNVGTELRRQLVAAAVRGDKTATSSLRSEYEPHTTDPLPSVGERAVLLDAEDEPVAVVETTEVRVVAAGDLDLAFAQDEGEGFETVAEWRHAHEAFWSLRIDDDTLVVAERFRIVELL